MLAVLQAFALIAVVVGVGGVVGRTGVLGDNARMVLNRTAFHVGVPALMLITLADTAPAKIFSPALLISAITALTVFGAYFAIVGRTLRRPPTSPRTVCDEYAESATRRGGRCRDALWPRPFRR